MQPDNLDDLFRQQLGGHATPPPADLWARLQATQQPEAAELLDTQFRATLGGHATPPRREVWERLEDEHLRPRPRRRRPVVAWWQLAAALLLFALVGGGLWRGGFLGGPAGSGVATAPVQQQKAVDTKVSTPKNQAVATPEAALVVAPTKKNQENFYTQATAPAASPSSPPIARTTRPRRPATARPGSKSSHSQGQQPDAAAAQLAHAGGRNTPAGQPAHPLVVPATPAPESPALAVAAAPAAAPQIIEVEVRRGSRPARPAAPAVAAAADSELEPDPARRPRLRMGNLLRQARHLTHGEQVSLAEAVDLPENSTVRVLSATIRL